MCQAYIKQHEHLACHIEGLVQVPQSIVLYLICVGVCDKSTATVMRYASVGHNNNI